jgi:hypothetical protein
MKYALCLLLGSLGSCHRASPAGSQYPAAQANPLLGHWRCDSVTSVRLDSAGHPLEAASLSPATIVLDVTPTQIALTLPGIMPGDTGFATYTRHGQELLMTFAPLRGEPVGLRSKGEQSQIITLTPTLFRMEKTAGQPGEMHRTRYFYHR